MGKPEKDLLIGMGIYLLIATAATAYYFAHFLIILPILGYKEKTTPVPLSISEPILTGSTKPDMVKKKELYN